MQDSISEIKLIGKPVDFVFTDFFVLVKVCAKDVCSFYKRERRNILEKNIRFF